MNNKTFLKTITVKSLEEAAQIQSGLRTENVKNIKSFEADTARIENVKNMKSFEADTAQIENVKNMKSFEADTAQIENVKNIKSFEADTAQIENVKNMKSFEEAIQIQPRSQSVAQGLGLKCKTILSSVRAAEKHNFIIAC